MVNISHKVGVESDQPQTLKALNSIEGLSKWWTTDVTGGTKLNDIIVFSFGDNNKLEMKVNKNSAEAVGWTCVSGPDEWIETQINFQLVDEEETVIYFQHKGWKAETPFHHHCSTKWAVFLLSLKQYLDTGQGSPFPMDQKITTKVN